MSSAGPLTGGAKRKEVGRLLKILDDGQDGSRENDLQILEVLAQLKIYSRDPRNAEPLYCKDGISTLASYAFVNTVTASREALGCIANAMLLAPHLRQDFMDLGLLQKAAEKLKSEEYNEEFLVSRIIFLLTYETNLNQDELLRTLSVASSINTHLLHHAEAYTSRKEKRATNSMASMALSETLKLLFNLSTRKDNAMLFQPAVRPILCILSDVELAPQCLEPPVTLLINALVNLDLGHTNMQEVSFTPAEGLRGLVDKLVSVLDGSLKSYEDTQLETSLPPLLTVLSKVCDFGDGALRTHMRENLLPIHEERDVPLGRSETLPSRLLRLSSSAMAPQLRELIPALMYKLSEQDPKKFIENIGYGFAAGFLASHSIAMPESVKQLQKVTGTGTNGIPVNPITGQRLDKEPEDTSPPMTMDEKEREAERLFVLFERLKATGVVNVQNPVEAMQNTEAASRIEEIDDSD